MLEPQPPCRPSETADPQGGRFSLGLQGPSRLTCGRVSDVRRLVLFDIDGTLVLTGGAGLRAMNHAFHQMFGIEDGFTGIPVAGRTDRVIIEDALSGSGLPPSEEAVGRFRVRYGELLREQIDHPGPRKGVMPGVRALLDSLAVHHRAAVALLTGNFPETAQIKLEHFLLWEYFDWGVFGDEASDRNDLMPIAMDRARARGLAPIEAGNVLVVGDTPADIECAAVVGATAVAVATGGYDAETLRAAGASVVFENLTDTERFLGLLEAGEPTPSSTT